MRKIAGKWVATPLEHSRIVYVLAAIPIALVAASLLVPFLIAITR